MTSANPPAESAAAYANWGTRVGAYLIDIAPIIVLDIINFAIGSFLISLLVGLIAIGWTIYNRWYMMGSTGQSLGKKQLGIKLISETTGQPIGPLMAFVRDICHVVDGIICFVGYLFPLWDAKAQTLADKIMTTVVIPA